MDWNLYVVMDASRNNPSMTIMSVELVWRSTGRSMRLDSLLSWWKYCEVVIRVKMRPARVQGPLGERPLVPAVRERRHREAEVQRQLEDDSAQGPVVRAKKAPSAPSMDEWEDHLAAGHAEYGAWCPFCVACTGKSEAHRRMEASRDHGHPERHLDYAYMGREAGDRASPILVGKFSKDRWLVTHPVPCKGTQHRSLVGELVNDVIMSGVQTLVIESDQEVSIMDVKNALTRKFRSIEGFKVMPEALRGLSLHTLSGFRTRCLNLAARSRHGLRSLLDKWLALWSVSDGRTAYERRKQKNYRKPLIPSSELVIFMPNEKPKDNGEVQNRVGIMLGLVDRSDEVVMGTPE